VNDFDLIPERGPGRRRPETLARKVDLLLETVMAENGQPFDYAAVRDAAQKSGLYVSWEQWELLKAGKEQSRREELLRALAGCSASTPSICSRGMAPLRARRGGAYSAPQHAPRRSAQFSCLSRWPH
jgi:hypothetical protein